MSAVDDRWSGKIAIGDLERLHGSAPGVKR